VGSSIFKKILANVHWPEFFVLFVVAMALSSAGNMILCLSLEECLFPLVFEWKLHQFVFSYADLGFVKRALVGSLLGLGPDAETSNIAIRSLAAAILVGLTAMLLILSFSCSRSVLGRLDQLNYLITLAILMSGVPWAIFLAPVMILIHEGSLLIHMPLLFVLHWHLHGRNTASLAAAALCVLVLAAVILFGGLSRELDLRAIYPNMSDLSYLSLSLSLLDGARFVMNMVEVRSIHFFNSMAILFIYSLIVLVVGGRLVAGTSGSHWLLGILGAYAPLLLAVVGIDWPRWIACTTMNLFILMFVFSISAPQNKAREADMTTTRLINIGFVYALLGPMGVDQPVPGIYFFGNLLF
jgi:hypothetical protein